MSKIWTLSIVALIAIVVLGCNKSDTETKSELSEGQTQSEVNTQFDQTENKTPEDSASESAGTSSENPTFKDYEYPVANYDGAFSSGNIESASYFTQDDLSKVLEFYDKKFPGSGIQAGTTTNFSKENPDGSHVSATVSEVGDKTQIILKLESKM